VGALLGLWKSWYRDLILVKAEGPEQSLINMDLSRELKIAAEAFRMDNLVSNLLALDQAEETCRVFEIRNSCWRTRC